MFPTRTLWLLHNMASTLSYYKLPDLICIRKELDTLLIEVCNVLNGRAYKAGLDVNCLQLDIICTVNKMMDEIKFRPSLRESIFDHQVSSGYDKILMGLKHAREHRFSWRYAFP